MRSLPCLLLLCVWLPAQAQRLRLVTEIAPPSQIVENATISGRATDKVRMMMERAGIASSIEVLPWARAYSQALSQRDTCVFSAARLPTREKLFQWIGPISAIEWVLYGLPERHFKFSTLEDARAYTIGSYRDDARDEYLRERGFRVESVGDDSLNVDKLLRGRIDLWGTTPDMMARVKSMRPAGVDIVPLLAFHRVDLYLACHPRVPAATIARLREAFGAMQRDGSIKVIDDRYAQPL